MRYLRSFADFPSEPGTHRPEFIAQLESCSVIKGGIPAGTAADPLHKHPVDQFYYVLEGAIDVQLGAAQVHAEPHTLVRIPAGTPHFAFNQGSEEVLQLELLLPTHVPARGGQMIELKELCDEEGGPPPPDCVSVVSPEGWLAIPGTVMETQILANRAHGSTHGMITVSRMAPTDAVPGYRLHDFDELCFVLDGTLTVDIGGIRHRAVRHELAIFPARVPYRAWNEGPGPEQHVTIVTPEPTTPNLADWSVGVDFAVRA